MSPGKESHLQRPALEQLAYYASLSSPNNTSCRPASFGPAPMQIDAAKFKPLTEAEKLRRRTNNLCLYYGNPGHIARQCPQKLVKLQVQATETPQELENKNIQSE
jgi:hypothetical protein